MKRPGQIALTLFSYTDRRGAKLRPVLLLRQASRQFDDWLVCMVSSQLHQVDPELDEPILSSQADFAAGGLKVPGVLRLSRLAVLDGARLAGSIGEIDPACLVRIRQRLARWITDSATT